MAMRQFGKVKFQPRPKTEAQWTALYKKHKVVLPNIQGIELHWSRRGPGQSGARFFKVLLPLCAGPLRLFSGVT